MASIFNLEAVGARLAALQQRSPQQVASLLDTLAKVTGNSLPHDRYVTATSSGTLAELFRDQGFVAAAAPALVAGALRDPEMAMRILQRYLSLKDSGYPDLKARDIGAALRGSDLPQMMGILAAAERQSSTWGALPDKGSLSLWKGAFFHFETKATALLRSLLDGGLRDRHPLLITALDTGDQADNVTILRWMGEHPEGAAYQGFDRGLLQAKFELQFLFSPWADFEELLSPPLARELPNGALLVYGPAGFGPMGSTIDDWSLRLLRETGRSDVATACITGYQDGEGETHLLIGTSDHMRAGALATMLTGTSFNRSRKDRPAGTTVFVYDGQVKGGPRSVSVFSNPALRRAHLLGHLYRTAYGEVGRADAEGVGREVRDLLINYEGVSETEAAYFLRDPRILAGNPPWRATDNRLGWVKHLYPHLDHLPPGMKAMIDQSPVGVAREIGMRSHQQDHFFFQETDLPAGLGFLAIVADGHDDGLVRDAGREASHLAIRTFRESLFNLLEGRSHVDEETLKKILRKAIRRTEEVLLSSLSTGGTTLVVAVRLGNKVFIANVGDSRAYHLPKGGTLRQITRDHHWRDGKHHNGLMLSHTLGDQNVKRRPQEKGYRVSAKPDIFVVEVKKGDCFLFDSDGIHVLPEEDIRRELGQHPQEAANGIVGGAALVWAASAFPQNADNMTALVIRN